MLKLTGYYLVLFASYTLAGSGQNFLHRLVEEIHYYGYEVEIHRVYTSDGYILNIIRIPHGRNNSDDQNKPVVLLQHGVFAAGSDYFAARENSAPYMLADNGFDVWVSNSRGTIISREHETMNADCDPEYWDFSWHEIGIYDLPSTIDYILDKTKQLKLFYIGHSHGTTVYYVLLSEKPEYNDKIILQISMAPIAFLKYMRGVTGLVKSASKPMGQLFHSLGVHEFKRLFFWFSIPMIEVTPTLYGAVLFMFAGFDYQNTNLTLLRTYPRYFPAGCTVKQIQHFAQSSVFGHFRQYDYGLRENLVRYGSITPPDYKLGNIRAPITFLYGGNDYFSVVKDVTRLYESVTNSVAKKLVRAPHKSWNHLDFLISKDVRRINNFLIDEMKVYLP